VKKQKDKGALKTMHGQLHGTHLFNGQLLRIGEKLLWSGRPRQDLALRPVDKVFFPSGLFLGLVLGITIYYSTGSFFFVYVIRICWNIFHSLY
jgi:hypothetical protein